MRLAVAVAVGEGEDEGVGLGVGVGVAVSVPMEVSEGRAEGVGCALALGSGEPVDDCEAAEAVGCGASVPREEAEAVEVGDWVTAAEGEAVVVAPVLCVARPEALAVGEVGPVGVENIEADPVGEGVELEVAVAGAVRDAVGGACADTVPLGLTKEDREEEALGVGASTVKVPTVVRVGEASPVREFRGEKEGEDDAEAEACEDWVSVTKPEREAEPVMEGLPLTLRLPRTLRLPLVLAVVVPLLLPTTPLGVAVGCSGDAVGRRGEGLTLPLPPSPPLLGVAVPDASRLVGVGGSVARLLPEETGEAEMEAQGEAERGGVAEAVGALLRVAVEHRDSVRVGVMEEVRGAEKDWVGEAVMQDRAEAVPARMEALAEAEELKDGDAEVEGCEKVGGGEVDGREVAVPPPPTSPGLALALLLAQPLRAPVTVDAAVRDAEAQPELLRLGSAVEVGAVPVGTTVNEGVGLCDPGSTVSEAMGLELATPERVGAEAEAEALPMSEALAREEAEIEGEGEAEPVGTEEREESAEAEGTPVSCGVRDMAAVGVPRGGEGVTLPLGARLLPEGLADTLREELTLTQREAVRVTSRLPVAQLVPGSVGVTDSVMGAVALIEAEPVLVAVATELALLGAEGAADSESAVVRVRLGDALTLGLRNDVTVAEEDARALLLWEAVGETEAEPWIERDDSGEGEPGTLRVTATTLGVESREGDEAVEGEAATLLLMLALLVPRSEGVLLAVAARPGEGLAARLREGSKEPVPTAVALRAELALLVASRDSVARAVKDAEAESEGVDAAVAVEDHEAPLPLGATVPEPRPLEGDREGEGDADKGAVALIVA